MNLLSESTLDRSQITDIFHLPISTKYFFLKTGKEIHVREMPCVIHGNAFAFSYILKFMPNCGYKVFHRCAYLNIHGVYLSEQKKLEKICRRKACLYSVIPIGMI